jgi:hypothetical protein
LRIDQRTNSQKRKQIEDRLFNNFHPSAVFFIEHPLGNDKLISAGKKQLNLMRGLTGE